MSVTRRTQPETQAPRLVEKDAGRSVIVETDDEDRFLVSMRDAVRHIREGESGKVWREEFDAVLRHVHGWTTRQRWELEACYAVLKTGRVRVFVVPPGGRFSCELGLAISDLNHELVAVSRRVDSHVSQVTARMAVDAANSGDFGVFYDLLAASG